MQRLWALLLLMAATPTQAQSVTRPPDFRVENRVYLGDSTEPVGGSTTLFSQGVVYDCARDRSRIAILDPLRRHWLLLDVTRRQKSQISLTYVEQFTQDLRTRVMERPPVPLFRTLAEVELTIEAADEPNQWLLHCAGLSYSVRGSGDVSGDVAQTYREFSDAVAMLNPLIERQSLPPFARLQVNAQLAEVEQLPLEVVLEYDLDGADPLKPVRLYSTHTFAMHMEPQDFDLLDDIQRKVSDFKQVPLNRYLAVGRKGETR